VHSAPALYEAVRHASRPSHITGMRIDPVGRGSPAQIGLRLNVVWSLFGCRALDGNQLPGIPGIERALAFSAGNEAAGEQKSGSGLHASAQVTRVGYCENTGTRCRCAKVVKVHGFRRV
jgi:hypothetical protein